MSALGDYVHLRKYNYFRYGTTRNTESSIDTNQWITLHTQIAQKIQDQKDSRLLQIESSFNNKMVSLKAYMKALEEATEQSNPELYAEKQRIYDELFAGTFKAIRQLIQVNMATGKISLGSDKSNLTLENGDLLKRMKESTSGYIKTNNLDSLDFNKIIQDSITQTRNVFNALKSVMSETEIKKTDQTRFSTIKSDLLKAKSYANKAINQIYTEIGATELPKNFQNLKSVTPDSKWVKIDSQLLYAVGYIIHARSLLKIPNLSTLKGKLMEILVRNFLQQGNDLAISKVCNTLGNVANKGYGKLQISKEVAKSVNTTKGSLGVNIASLNTGSYKDKVMETFLTYEYESQRKADVNFQWKVQEGEEKHFDFHGISVKNYMTHTIGLVSKSSLLAFLINNPFFDENRINHLLNSITESNNDLIDDISASSIMKLRLEANQALRLNILWSAISGQNVGKDIGNSADFMILNVPYLTAQNEYTPIAVSTHRIIQSILSNQSLNSAVSVQDDLGRDLATSNFYLSNKYKDVSNNSSKAKWSAAFQRIANIINELHERKISVTIPQQAVLTANSNLVKSLTK